MNQMVYFDNAATSYPKPEGVYRAVDHFLREIGASPGRSAHRLGVSAGRVVLVGRERLARLFNVKDSSRIILSPNCTEALNLAIKGLLRPGNHVVTSSVEHNSVMRPLRRLETAGAIELTVVPCSREGRLNPSDVANSLKANTRLVVVCHASNVMGTIQPLADIRSVTAKRDIVFLVDAAQSAGTVPINMSTLGIDLLAFSGHKGLLGPQGTGGLVIGNGVELLPIKEGGTGSLSDREVQPDYLPDRYESGTLNGPGIAGLAAGVAHIEELGVDVIREKLRKLTALLLHELSQIPGVTIYGPQDPKKQTAVVSFTLAGLDIANVAALLDERFGVMTRAGFHCSPAAHKTIGSFDTTMGAVRASLGLFNTAEEIHYFGRCLRELQAEGSNKHG